jgi:hypothetical protein
MPRNPSAADAIRAGYDRCGEILRRGTLLVFAGVVPAEAAAAATPPIPAPRPAAGRQTTAGSSSRTVPRDASISASAPTGTVH